MEGLGVELSRDCREGRHKNSCLLHQHAVFKKTSNLGDRCRLLLLDGIRSRIKNLIMIILAALDLIIERFILNRVKLNSNLVITSDAIDLIDEFIAGILTV